MSLYTAAQARGVSPVLVQKHPGSNSSAEASGINMSASSTNLAQSKFGLFNTGGPGGLIGQLTNSAGPSAQKPISGGGNTPKQPKMSTKAVGKSGGPGGNIMPGRINSK